MAAKRGGLSGEQIVQLRDDVAAGKYPRVQIVDSQFADAIAGTVRMVGDPSVDGQDFVTVRVKINGVTDDLRFAPRELSRGKRGQSKSTTSTAATRATVAAAPSPRARQRQARRPASRTPVAAAPAVPQRDLATRKSRKPVQRTASSAPVSIVVSSVGASWTVSAQRGARTVLKNAAVNPGVVSAIAALLDLPAVEDAVAAVNDTARALAETRADQLRAELAQIQAVLDSHRRP